VKVRQVVTGHNQTGQAIFFSDQTVAPIEAQLMPGFKTFELWSTAETPSVPHQGSLPGVPHYFPALGGSVFRVINFPAQPGSAPDLDISETAVAEVQDKLPGLLEHMELDAPGMHTTDSVDYGIVLRGEIYLELDNGVERLLTAGDCVIQNGTRHAWHNRSQSEAIMAFILQGAEREKDNQ